MSENDTTENRFCQEAFARECQDEGIDPQDIKLAIETIKAMRKGEKVLCQKEI